MKQILRIGIAGQIVGRMLRQIILIRKKRPHPSQLYDTLITIHDGQLIYAHQIVSQLLAIHVVGLRLSPCFTGVTQIDGFLAEGFIQIL